MVVGIEAIGFYFPKQYVSLEELAKYRRPDGNPQRILSKIKNVNMVIPQPFEDSVTMAANALDDLLKNNFVNFQEVGRIQTATENPVDFSNSISTYLHGLFQSEDSRESFPSHCDVLESKQACIAGTQSLEDSIRWLNSKANKDKKALVIMSDISRYHQKSSGEFTQGAGSIALLLSNNPKIISFDVDSVGTHTVHLSDFYRPLNSLVAIVDGKLSKRTYIESLKGSFANYKQIEDSLNFDNFDNFAFHTPYAGLVEESFLELAKHLNVSESVSKELFEEKVKSSLIMSKQIGNIFTGSLYLAMASLLETKAINDNLRENQNIAFYSYGSGTSAKFFVGKVLPGSIEEIKRFELQKKMDNYIKITPESYDEMFYNKRVNLKLIKSYKGWTIANDKDNIDRYQKV